MCIRDSVHTLQPFLPIAGVTPGKIADRRAAIKEAQYQAGCFVAGMGFCSLVYETKGAWSTPATKFIWQLAWALTMKTGNRFPHTSNACLGSLCTNCQGRGLSSYPSKRSTAHLLALRMLREMDVDGEPEIRNPETPPPVETSPGSSVQQTNLSAPFNTVLL